MKRLLLTTAIFTMAAFAQTPTITTIQNNYARIAEGASNYGIAQGSIFIVKGSNLSPTGSDVIHNFDTEGALKTTRQGTRIRITVNGVTAYAPMYYALDFQLAGVLPSNIPEGTGTLVVERNGNNSAPAVIKVVKSAFGVLAFDFETGTGRAIVHDQNYAFLGDSNATNPNKFVVFYGSGMGPQLQGVDETSVIQPGRDMTEIPISVTVGGVAAEVVYRGRSYYPGLDQFNLKIPTLPDNVYSCNVAVVITTNGVVGNATTIPVAATGTVCSDPPNPGGDGGSTNQPTLSQQQINEILGRGSYKFGTVNSLRNRLYASIAGQTTTTITEEAFGTFAAMSGPDLAKYLSYTPAIGLSVPAAGVCDVFNGQTLPAAAPNVTISSLDAGDSLTLQYPPGTLVMPKQVSEGYINYEANTPTSPSGRYTYSGTGGTQVGAFTVGVDVAAPAIWTNRAALEQVTRSSGVTLTWTGGEPGTLIVITGLSAQVDINNPTTPVSAKGFICYANQSAGQFTVPASVLNQLPATAAIDPGFGIPPIFFSPGTLSLSSTGKYATTTASGVDLIIATSADNTIQTTIYK